MFVFDPQCASSSDKAPLSPRFVSVDVHFLWGCRDL